MNTDCDQRHFVRLQILSEYLAEDSNNNYFVTEESRLWSNQTVSASVVISILALFTLAASTGHFVLLRYRRRKGSQRQGVLCDLGDERVCQVC